MKISSKKIWIEVPGDEDNPKARVQISQETLTEIQVGGLSCVYKNSTGEAEFDRNKVIAKDKETLKKHVHDWEYFEIEGEKPADIIELIDVFGKMVADEREIEIDGTTKKEEISLYEWLLDIIRDPNTFRANDAANLANSSK